MFTNTPFESANNAMMGSSDKFNLRSMQESMQFVLANLRAWGELAQAQAQATQTFAKESASNLTHAADPKASYETCKTHAQRVVALSAKHIQEVTELGVDQFNTSIDLIQERHPLPLVFSPVAKMMILTASALESGVISALKTGVEAAEVNPVVVTPGKKSHAR